jgi:hypothetical protein
MTTETAADIQALTSILQTTFAFLQTVLIALTLRYAVKESTKWRSQLVGAKFIDLSYQLDAGIHDILGDLATLLGFIDVTRKPGARPGDFNPQMEKILSEIPLKVKDQSILETRSGAKYRSRLAESSAKLTPIFEHIVPIAIKVMQNEPLDPKDMDLLDNQSDAGEFGTKVDDILNSYIAICEEMRQ